MLSSDQSDDHNVLNVEVLSHDIHPRGNIQDIYAASEHEPGVLWPRGADPVFCEVWINMTSSTRSHSIHHQTINHEAWSG